jgi:hypothetical protein
MPARTVEALEGKRIGEYALRVEARRISESERSVFRIFPLRGGEASSEPILEGTQSLGVGYLGIEGWIDCRYYERAAFPGGPAADFAAEGLSEKFFAMVGALVPDGGSLMVAYDMAWGMTRLHSETARMLNAGAPPESTPIGRLLAAAGCGASMKDWYFPEGGSEGNMKLQGFKHAKD